MISPNSNWQVLKQIKRKSIFISWASEEYSGKKHTRIDYAGNGNDAPPAANKVVVLTVKQILITSTILTFAVPYFAKCISTLKFPLFFWLQGLSKRLLIPAVAFSMRSEYRSLTVWRFISYDCFFFQSLRATDWFECVMSDSHNIHLCCWETNKKPF